MTKSTSLQQYILFIGGLLAGVLVSITIVQNGTSPDALLSFFSPSAPVQSNVPVTPVAMTQPTSPTSSNPTEDIDTGSSVFNSLVERFSAADASWMKPVLPAIFTNTAMNTPPVPTTVPKWTPGQAATSDGAAAVHELQLDGDSEGEGNGNGAGVGGDSTADVTTMTIPEDTKALNRMIKRLRRRQAELEKKGQDSTAVVEKLASLMSAKLGLSTTTTTTTGTAAAPTPRQMPLATASAAQSRTSSSSSVSTATGAPLVTVEGHADVTDTSSAVSLLDAAFGKAPAPTTASNKASATTTTSSTATTTTPNKKQRGGGRPTAPQGKEAVVFGTPEEDTHPRALPSDLPIIPDTFPPPSDASLYLTRRVGGAPNAAQTPASQSGLPPIPYHHQAQRDFTRYTPYIPTLPDAQANRLPLPDMKLQRATYEHREMNLKLHLCNAVFEAYSASYLTTKQHLLEIASESYNLTWVNCEMASFIHMKESSKFYATPDASGIIIQSLDVLDFSVIHLSAFERSSKRHKDKIWTQEKDRRTQWHKIEEVIRTGVVLQRLNDPKYGEDRRYKTHVEAWRNATVSGGSGSSGNGGGDGGSGGRKSKRPAPAAAAVPTDDRFNRARFAPLTTRRVQYSAEANRTVVIMPFLGGAMGAGHSELGNRFEYLKTCFWSLYEFFPHIVAAVTRVEDVDWAMTRSGLPFFDLLLIEDLPKSAGLPVATTQQTKYRLLHDPVWSAAFDFVFFTESDQILISRELQAMYAHLQKYPRHMILPHRLMPYSQDAIVKGLGRKDVLQRKTTASAAPIESAWMNMSCCMPRQNCVERKTWKHLSDPAVPIINFYGLYVPLGNVNFLDEKYRTCTLTPYVGDYCP